MNEKRVILITGTRKGIGRYLVEYYVSLGHQVIGCSRNEVDYKYNNYQHFCLDICDESKVKKMFSNVRKSYGRLDILINNAGIASMNHALLTTLERIVNFATVASPLKLEGEAIYASSKAAVINLTEILAREFSIMGITINVIGPTPVKTDLIKSVPKNKIKKLIERQAIQRYGDLDDIVNVLNFFIKPESNFITGQVIYLGGV